LIFFEWNDASLSDRARRILAEAFTSWAQSKNSAFIQINGYDDLSQTRTRAQAISQRRANAVAEALVRLGWPRDRIRIAAFGKNDPLAPTEDGVREPMNRRVELILRPQAVAQ
jgi:outer membrane protein OmpA-like peptidoglycan-associated protein